MQTRAEELKNAVKLFDDFLEAIYVSEEMALQVLTDIMQLSPPVLFEIRYSQRVNHNGYQVNLSSDNPGRCTYLHLAVIKNYPRLMAELLKYNISKINLGWYCQNPTLREVHFTPLMMACFLKNIEAVKVLLAYNVDLLYVGEHNKYNILQQLAYSYDEAIVDLILNAAKKDNILFGFTEHTEQSGSPFFMAAEFGNAAYFRKLIEQLILNSSSLADGPNLLSLARRAYFKHPEKSTDFDDICELIKSHSQLKPKLNNPQESFTARISNSNFSGNYLNLFGLEFPKDISAKNLATRKVMAQIYTLLRSPEACLPYLQFLDQEFRRYDFETFQREFNYISEDTYKFHQINDLLLPLPKANYDYSLKNGDLPSFLVQWLRQFGLAEKTYEWIGPIPYQISNSLVSEGCFFTEARFGVGLFHNKFSHMLQLAIIVLALYEGHISTQYNNKGMDCYLSMQDISSAFIHELTRDKESLWHPLRDSRYFNGTSFTDPFKLASFIMYNGSNLQVKAIADFMIGSFCTDIHGELHQAHQATGAYQDLTIEALADKYHETKIHELFFPKHLYYEAIKEKDAKNILYNKEGEFAVVETEYASNDQFLFKQMNGKPHSKAIVVYDEASYTVNRRKL